MRFPAAALPLLAGLSLVEAQLDFAPVIKVAPQITTNTPFTTQAVPITVVAEASSIISSLSSAHDASVSAESAASVAATATSSASSSATSTASKKKKKGKATKAPAKGKKVTTSATPTPSPKAKGKGKKHPKSKVHARDVLIEERAVASTSTSSAQVCTQTNSIFYGYVPTPNTPAGFLADQSMSNKAAGEWMPPAGYWTSFQNSFGATIGVGVTLVDGYLTERQQGSYNTSTCAQVCNAEPKCQGFNIYFEREPTYVPNNTTCRNPASAADVKCALWGQWIYNASSTNYGVLESDFYLVIQGSNGYNKLTPFAPVSNFTGPTALVGAVSPSSASSYLMKQTFYNSYDPNQCGNQCYALTQSNRAAAISKGASTYSACNYFNVFNLTYGGSPATPGSASLGNPGSNIGMYCQLFTDDAAGAYGTLGAANYNNVMYNLTGSSGYALYPQDAGSTKTTWAPAPTGSAAACSNLGSVGSTLVDYNGANYTLACNYDVSYTQVSADIGNAPAPDFYSCFNLCDNFAGCSAFSYYQGLCYFKNLTGATVTPQYNTNPSVSVDFAYLTNQYAGFGASTIAATVTYTTYTTAYTGAATATVTSLNGLNGYVIVETPGGAAATGVQTVTSLVDRGTATTVSVSTVPTTSGASTVTVIKYYPTPVTTCGNAGVRFAGYSNLVPGGQNTASYPAFSPEAYKTRQPTIYATPTTTTYVTTSYYPTSTVQTNVATVTSICYGYFYNYYCNYQTTQYTTSSYTSTSTSTVTSATTPTVTPTGLASYLAESNSGSTGITVYGQQNVDGTNLVLDHTFYLFAGRGTGYYSFQIPYTDDAAFIWFGQKALSGWSRNNADITQFWPNQNPVSLAFYLNLGTYMPVRVMWGNGGGPGAFQLNIYGPDGSIMLASTAGANAGYLSPDIVSSPCNASLGAPFPAWGAEK